MNKKPKNEHLTYKFNGCDLTPSTALVYINDERNNCAFTKESISVRLIPVHTKKATCFEFPTCCCSLCILMFTAIVNTVSWPIDLNFLTHSFMLIFIYLFIVSLIQQMMVITNFPHITWVIFNNLNLEHSIIINSH